MATATKKGAARARASKYKGGVKGRSWNWGHTNSFVLDTKKWTKDARLRLPANPKSVLGCVFRAVQKLKRASDDDILAECLRVGLSTKQNKRKQVQIKLRRLKRWGVVARDKNTKKALRRKNRERRTATVVKERTTTKAGTAPVAQKKRPTEPPNAAQDGNTASKAPARPVKATKPATRPSRPVRTPKPPVGQPKADGGASKAAKPGTVPTVRPDTDGYPGTAPTEEPDPKFSAERAADEPRIMEQGMD